jgi:hypothetical protein
VGAAGVLVVLVASFSLGSWPKSFDRAALVTIVLDIAANVLLFRRDARAWFHGEPTDLRDVFS